LQITSQNILSSFPSPLSILNSTRLLQTCFASAIEGLFELCLRIRAFPIVDVFFVIFLLTNSSGLHPNSDPNTGKKAQTEKDIITLVQKLYPATHSSKHIPGPDSSNVCNQCDFWRARSFHIFKKVFVLLHECGDSLDLPKALH
jgi:hypothetical protein